MYFPPRQKKLLRLSGEHSVVEALVSPGAGLQAAWLAISGKNVKKFRKIILEEVNLFSKIFGKSKNFVPWLICFPT